MTKLQKIMLPILAVLCALVMSVDLTVYKALFVNPERVHVTYKTITDPLIPSSMNDISVVYISDLEYGEFGGMEQTQKLIDKINSLQPDLFLFGGDVFSENITPSADQISQMSAWLGSIEAPLGKFAVFGEQDLIDQTRTDTIRQIMHDAGIEILENRSLPITNFGSGQIRLAGLSPEADVEAARAGMVADQFNLVLSHYPDNLMSDRLDLFPISYALAGNAHGTQITWPFKGGYRKWTGSTEYNRARKRKLSFKNYLTSGVGCIKVDARLNAPVEIVYMLLSSR